jgi:ankyrin repeat protein
MHCAAILLQNGADVNALDNFNRTALHHAACSDSNYAVDFLLSHGAAISTRDAFGRTPLHAACHSNSHNFLTHVLKTVRHIDLESQDYNGSTPLHLAAQSSEIDCLAILLNLGVNTEASDAHHRTPLHIATKNPGGYNSAKLLLAYGASTGALSRDLQMPLHMACARGDANIIQMYLDFGAVVSVHDCLKITPLHIASERGNLAVIHMLLCHLSKCFAANDFVYSENSYFDRVSMGIPSPTFKGILGYAELNRVIRLTLNSIQSGGLHQGAIRTTLDLTDQCGDTPLHKACMQKKLSAVIFLIFVGASATKVNRSGLSPLDILAAKSPSMYRYAASFCEWFSKTPLLIVLFPRPSRTMSAASTQISSGFRCECDVGRRWPLAYSTLQIDIIKQLVLEYLA